MAGTLPPCPFKRGEAGAEAPFHNRIDIAHLSVWRSCFYSRPMLFRGIMSIDIQRQSMDKGLFTKRIDSY